MPWLLGVLIWLIVFVCVAAVVWWFLQRVDVPDPIRYVVIAVVAIIALMILWGLLPNGAPLRLR